MRCKICQTNITNENKQALLGNQFHEFEERERQELLGGIGVNIKKCPNCNEFFEFEKGKVDYNAKDEKGQKLSKESAQHYAENRCKCPNCKTEFCIQCKKLPYHMGKQYYK